MLHELANYVNGKGINVKPGFKAKASHWTIQLTVSGQFVDVYKDERDFTLCPHLEQSELVSGREKRSHFLLATLPVVTGYKSSKKADKEKHDYFKNLLVEASEFEPMLKMCTEVLENELIIKKINDKLEESNARATESITFKVGNIYPIELDTWHSWWQEFRSTLRSENTEQGKTRCFLTGELVDPVRTHPKVSGLRQVGGDSSGVLIGFDKDSFESYGLKQSLNATVSEEAASTYVRALDELISEAPRPLANTLYLHWYKESLSKEDDLLDSDVFGEDDSGEYAAMQNVERIFQALKEGQRPEYTDNKYYILQVSATGGRIMVRDWITGDFYELVTNLRKWFSDIQIIKPYGSSLTSGFKISAALMRLVPYRAKENPRDTFRRASDSLAPLMPRFYRSIITDQPLPDFVAAKSLLYIRSKLLQADDNTSMANLDWISCGLLKAWLIRRDTKTGGGTKMKTGLNKNHPSVSYQIGRMMAVLAEIQKAALGDVGAGVIQKYYAAASTTPALVLGRLIKTAQYHLDKMSKGLAYWYEDQLAEIASKMGDNIPSTLSLEEQALFALGYYQQKAHMLERRRTKADDTDISKKEEDEVNVN